VPGGKIVVVNKLTSIQIGEYFKEHLPYRTGMLLAHYRMTRKSWTGDVNWLNACFVASLVTGRLFLNFLGIGKENGKPCPFRSRADDVDAQDLGGKLIDLATLPPGDEALFMEFLKMADKAAAHFTTPIVHDWSKTHEMILRIHHYLKVNLYDHTGRRFEDAIP
jgi:hypothetical protein